MNPADPFDESPRGQGSARLAGRTAFITGAGSGIGRAVALPLAREGARVAITHRSDPGHSDPGDARETLARIRDLGGPEGVALPLDVASHASIATAAKAAEAPGGRIDALVRVASVQVRQERLLDLPPKQAEATLRAIALGSLWAARAALPRMGRGGAIAWRTSGVACRGNPPLIGDAVSKGAELVSRRQPRRQPRRRPR